MINELYKISSLAGKIILNYYGDKNFLLKEDHSPLTMADQASHDFLCKALTEIKNIPILSEENEVPYEIRKEWKEFWMIDPLDGTKEFINGIDEFSINIALIQGNRPVIGSIYAPALEEFYGAVKNEGVRLKRKQSSILEPLNPLSTPLTKPYPQDVIVATSRFHHSSLSQEFMKVNGFTHTSTIGAAIKFGRLASGEIDIYPRFEGSKEWDTAAGQIILEEAGGTIMDVETKQPLLYNKEDVRNNYFIAGNAHLSFNLLEIANLQ